MTEPVKHDRRTEDRQSHKRFWQIVLVILVVLPYGIAGYAINEAHDANDRADRVSKDLAVVVSNVRDNQIDGICGNVSAEAIERGRNQLIKAFPQLTEETLRNFELNAYDDARRRLDRIKADCTPPLPPPGQIRPHPSRPQP